MRRWMIVPIVLLAGCGDGRCRQGDVRALSVGVTDRLNAVALGYFYDYSETYTEGSSLIVGDDGLVLWSADGMDFHASRPAAADLFGVTFAPSSRVFVAGAGGTLLRGRFGSDEWLKIPLGTTADLWAVEWVSVGGSSGSPSVEYVIAVGDEVVAVRDPVDERWDLVPAPEGGWGKLRAVVGGRQLHVAGLGGVLWSADSISGPWTRAEGLTGADLLDGGIGWAGEAVLVGSDGTMLEATASGAWTRHKVAGAGDLIGFAGWDVLAADGRVYDIILPDEPEEYAWSLPGGRAIAGGSDIVVVGEGGLASRVPMFCE